MDLKVKFEMERETKGAVLYKELNAEGQPIATNYDGVIGSVYIRKTALNTMGFKGSWPTNIT